MPERFYPFLLIVILGLLFFFPVVVHPSEVLYSDHSDLIALHLPAKHFLVHSWCEIGELPLWCPYQFAGESFVADIMAATFYPPHLLLLLLPEDRLGMALSWLVVFHVVLAGWCMYGYARMRGLSAAAACIAAVGFMFAGSWLQRLLLGGHYLLIGLAWLPLVLVLVERAMQRSSLASATAAGGVYALLILGTAPQLTFYASLFIALWSFVIVLERAPGRRWRTALSYWLGYGLWMVLVGVGLAAVQLLPTLEAARFSSRAQGIGSEEILDGGLRSLLFLVGPALTTEPANLQWEDRGGLAFLWLFAAVAAAWLGQRRVRYEAGVALVLLGFAVGGAVLVQGLPGFRLFRQPTRMFVLLGFPVAFLAGTATQMLFIESDSSNEKWRSGRRIFVRLLCAVAILSGGFALRQTLEHKPLRLHIYWLSLLLTLPAAYWIIGQTASLPRRRALMIWILLLLIDLWTLMLPPVQTRRETSLYTATSCVDWLIHHGEETGRILDRDDHLGGSATPLGTGAPLAMLDRLEALRGYNSIDNLRYKEYLQFIAGQDAPLQAQSGPLTYPVLGDFPIVHKKLLDLLGVRYLVQPRVRPPEQPSEWREVQNDVRPEAFDFIAGGLRELPPYTIWENRTVLPRAFVVFRSAPLPERHEILPRLLATDLRAEVLLENDVSATNTVDAAERRAAIRSREPNRVVVEVESGSAGWLVLSDLWYPGWKCHIADKPVSVERADYLFRAVALPEGKCEVVFTFEPESYLWGRRISLATLLLLGGIFTQGLGFRVWGLGGRTTANRLCLPLPLTPNP